MSKAEPVTLTREAILEHTTLRTERVEVPEWGGAVFVREMTGSERDSFEASIVDLKSRGGDVKPDNIRAKLAARTIVDAEGARLFRDVDVEDLGRLSAAALSRVYNAAARLSGISEADVEELAGN